MKRVNRLILLSAVLVALSGCGGGGGSSTEPTPTKPVVSGISDKNFDVIACSDPGDSGCLDAKAFDLKKENVAILNPPKDIGVGEYAYYDGKRFGVVPKDVKELSPLNFVAYGLYEYAKEVGSDWCGPCRLVAPTSFSDAKEQLKELFGLTGTKEQNEALLWLLNKNLETMGDTGLPVKEAYFADIKAMAESLVNLTKKGTAPDLSGLHLVKDSKGRVLGISSTPKDDCPDYLGGCIESWGVLDKNRAIDIGYNINQKSGTLSDSQKAFESLTCEANEEKQIFMYGVEDNFDPSNPEPMHPQGNTPSGCFSVYDTNRSYHHTCFFVESLINLPSDITKGRMAMGLRRETWRDWNFYWLIIGNSDGTQTLNPTDQWTQVPNSNTYYKDLDQIIFQVVSGSSALASIQNGNNYLNVYGRGFMSIDYIAVAACVPKPKPEGKPIAEVPINFECKSDAGEHLVTIWGGNGDDFATPVDNTTPPSGLGTTIKYDENISKLGTFADRINLPNQTITKLAILTNTRAGAPGYQNDQMFIGSFNGANSVGLMFDPNANVYMPTLNSGVSHLNSGTDLVQNSSGSAAGNLLSLANSNHYIDVIAYDQTEVDSVKVLACVVDKKEGDLNITKKAGKTFTKGDINYAEFYIDVAGTLPQGETLTIEETVANGATLAILNAPSPWNCSPNAPVYGPATVMCSITATNGDIANIPPISLTMGTKLEKLENCVEINSESQNVFYNNNPVNDKDCTTVVFEDLKEGDLAITKKINNTYTRGGSHYAEFIISVSGTLPANQSFTVNEVVQSGNTLTQLNAASPWNCSTNAPVSGQATVQCTITAGSNDLTNIPDISVVLKSSNDKIENCAAIDDNYSPVIYNTNTANDRACDTASFTNPPKVCSQRYTIDLDNPNLWIDDNGNHPTVNNPIPNTWDNSYTWFNFSQTPYAYYTLKTEEFCACGDTGYVKLKGMRIDNVGSLVLDNISANTSTIIASQNTATTHNFLAAYPPAVGSAVIPASLVGKNYQLKFNIHNHKIWSGGALKGKLIFTGHFGKCTKFDYLPEKPMLPISTNPVIFSDVNSTGVFDDNTTVAVVEQEKSTLPTSTPKLPAVVKGSDLSEITKTPEQLLGNKLPSNYSIVVACVGEHINVIIKNTVTKVYETNIKCKGDWVKYYEQ